MSIDYQVELTPLLRADEYGSSIDISDYVEVGGVPLIRRELDQGDYDIGIFNYGSISIKLNNYDGKFNDRSMDARSIFPWYRDRAKIEITFIDSASGETISFKGIIADKATRQNLKNQTIIFTLLSLDSIFQQVSIVPSTISNGITFSEAFKILLNDPVILTILNFDPSDINPTIDLIIDDGSKFDNLLIKTAIDKLLLASNSILYIDGTDTIIIRSRDDNNNTPYNFYHNDQYKRDNIDLVSNFNNGLHRMFNSVIVNDVEIRNQNSINEFATRQKNITINFITDDDKSYLIAQSIIGEFAIPRNEMEVTTSVEVAKDILLLDLVTVSYKSAVQSTGSQLVGIYEIDEYDKTYYPIEVGDIQMDHRILYKVIGIFENPTTFKTTIKLKDTGALT